MFPSSVCWIQSSLHLGPPLTTVRLINCLLGVGGHLVSGEMGEFLYTAFRYILWREMAEEVNDRQSIVGALEMVPTNNQHESSLVIRLNNF